MFSDGAFAYSDVSLSSSYEAAKAAYNKATTAQESIDGLTIGGRNLALSTATPIELAPGNTNDYCWPTEFYKTSPYGLAQLADERNATFTLSFDWSVTGADTPTNGRLSLKYTTTTFTNIGGSFPIVVGNSSGHFCRTFTPTSGMREYGTGWLLSGMGTANRGIKVTLSNFKFEVGNRPSDWSPAPEDVEAATAQAQAAADAAQQSVDDLRIGGRNLLLNTGDYEGWYIPVSSVNAIDWPETGVMRISASGKTELTHYRGEGVLALKTEELIDTDEPYVISFEIMSPDWSAVSEATSTNVGLQAVAASLVSADTPMGGQLQYIYTRLSNSGFWEEHPEATDGQWMRFVSKQLRIYSDKPYTIGPTWGNWYDRDTKALGQYLRFGITLRCNGEIRIRRAKIERGTRATDWTPAPEDATEAINSVQALAEQALANADCIVGTQTAATNAWTGRAAFSALSDGQVIMYWLPYAGTSTEATLNLTLSGGSTTGAKNVYIDAATRCTTHISAGNLVQMVYRENVKIGSTNYTGWWICRARNDNNYDRVRFNNAIKAKSAISAARLIVGDGSGFFHVVAGSIFDADKPILWAVSAIAAAATGTNNYLSFPSCTMRNNIGSSWTATQYATLYLAGRLSGNSFTVAESNWLTTAPADASLTYISLGYMVSSYQIYLYPEHPMYRLVGGELTAVSQLAYEAQLAASTAQAAADSARAEFKRVVRIDDDGLHVGDNQASGEVLIDSESVNVVVNGLKYSRFGGDFVQFGNYQLRLTSDGGLAFKRTD